MERTRELARGPLYQRDPELQGEMERLRQHWQKMSDDMETGLGIMERVQKRIGQP